MKKTFKTLFTLALLAIGISVNAEEIKIDFATNTWGKAVVETAADKKVEANAFGSATVGKITITAEKYNNTTYYPALRTMVDGGSGAKSAPYLDLVKSNSLTISTSEGKISSLDVNYTSIVAASKFNGGDWTSTITNGELTEEIKLNEATAELQLVMYASASIKSIVVYLASTGGGDDKEKEDDKNKEDDKLTEDEKSLDDNVVVDLSKRLIVLKESYGDAMGEVSRNVCTGQKSYYYDKNLNLAIVANNKVEMEGLNFTTTDFQYYNYDENNNLVSVNDYQIGTYDFGDKAVKESRAGTASYTYNEKNQRITMHTEKDGDVEYTYNDKGLLETEHFLKSDKTLQYTYNENGTIASVENVVTDEYAYTRPAEAYKEVYTYSAAGRLIKVEKQYSRDIEYRYASLFGKDLVKTMYGGTPIEKKTWKYVGGYLAEEYVYNYNNDQEEIPASRFIYKYSDDKNSVSYLKEVYNESLDKWFEQPQVFVETYKDFTEIPASTYACEIVSVKQSTDATDPANTVVVEFTMPELIMTDQNLDLIVYRDGMRIQTVNPVQWDAVPEFNLSYDEKSGHLIYKEQGVKNGTHEYFFQTAPTVGGDPIMGPNKTDDIIDDQMGLHTFDHEESHIVSNRSAVEVFTQLPTPTNVKVVGKSTASGGMNVTFQFAYDGNPSDPKYGFKETFISVDGGLFYDEAKSTRLPSTTQLTEEFESSKECTAEIIARYTLGLAKSAPFVFVPATVEVEDPTGINEINAEVANGKTMLFDLQGRSVKALTRGTFIMVTNGKAQKISVN